MSKIIPVSKSGKYFAIVDDQDFERVSKHWWYLNKDNNKNQQTFYARTKQKKIDFSMHRFILNLPAGNKPQIDHINFNGLDNRKSNLRICTASQNQIHKRKMPNKTNFTGVKKGKGSIIVQIRFKGERYFFTGFKTLGEAGKFYKQKAIELYGEFAIID